MYHTLRLKQFNNLNKSSIIGRLLIILNKIFSIHIIQTYNIIYFIHNFIIKIIFCNG